LAPRQAAFGHAIVRDIQEIGAPSNDTGKWTFIKPIRLPLSVVISIGKKAELNTHIIDGKKMVMDVLDEEYGCDINISYDKLQKDPNKKYDASLGRHTPLTDEEKRHLKFAYDFEKLVKLPTPEEQRDSLRMNGYYSSGGEAVTVSAANTSAGVGEDDEDQAPATPGHQFQQQQEATTTLPPQQGVTTARVSMSQPEEPAKAAETTAETKISSNGNYDKSVTFSLPAVPDPVSADEMQQIMLKFASDNNLTTEVYQGNGKFNGFEMPKCFPNFVGKKYCFACKARKDCSTM
jgi:hypothetical protein